jgi:hypothetical protein
LVDILERKARILNDGNDIGFQLLALSFSELGS